MKIAGLSLLHTILDSTDTIYILLDTGFRIVTYNPRAVEFVKNEWRRPIKTNDCFLEYIPPAQRQILLDYKNDISYEQSYPHPGGAVNWYSIRMLPIPGEDKRICGILISISDITEKKLLENQLLSRKAQEQKDMARAVLKAQEMMRHKIGLELHDNVNQILVSVRLYIDAIEREPQIRMDLIAQAKDYLDLAIAEIRSLGKKQTMPQKGFNLKEGINELLLDINTRSGTKFSSNIPADLALDDELKLNIYRIVQEQTVNILKHADASAADIAICPIDKTILIRITDNGKGFNPLVRRKGIGISNMINRVESYNGEVLIDSHPGQGCRIEIRIPS